MSWRRLARKRGADERARACIVARAVHVQQSSTTSLCAEKYIIQLPIAGATRYIQVHYSYFLYRTS